MTSTASWHACPGDHRWTVCPARLPSTNQASGDSARAAGCPATREGSLDIDTSRAVFTLLVNVIATSPLIQRRVRRWLYRLAGIRVGRSAIAHGCFVGSPQLAIGDDTFVNVGVFFDGAGRITIGSNVHIAMGAMILTSSHEIGAPERRGGTLTASDVAIGDGVWVGARATILQGVRIGDGAVIGAGALVTRSCEANAVYAGVPARKVRSLDEPPTGD